MNVEMRLAKWCSYGFPVIAGLLGLGGCSGSNPTTAPETISSASSPLTVLSSSSSIAPATTIHKIIRPSGQTTVLIDTGLTYADCFVTDSEPPTTPPSSLEVASDDLGQVRFSIDPGSYVTPINLIVNCQAQESTSTIPLELDVGDNPSLADEIVTPRGKARPPLSGDPMSYTQAQVIAAGFPPRPDPGQSLDAYNRWLSLVSLPGIQVPSGTVPIHARFDNSPNWSGSVTTTGGTQYWDANGYWYVPSVSGSAPCPGSESNQAAIWPGIGGTDGGGLIQAGSWNTVNVTVTRGLYCQQYNTFSTGAWMEYIPNGPFAAPNLTISPGDELYVEVWSGDASGNFAANGPYGWYFIYDYATTGYSQFSVAKPSGTTFYGTTAEWILEDPNSSGSLPGQGQYLADYGNVWFYYAESYDDTYGWLDLNQQSYKAENMYNCPAGGCVSGDSYTLMSQPSSVNSGDNFSFQWYYYGP